MTRFAASVHSSGTVPAPRQRVWDALADPDRVVAMTPLLARIEVDGEDWRWHMRPVGVLGARLTPVFTERMRFQELDRIDFAHVAPTGAAERAGADGSYLLTDEGAATRLEIVVTVTVDLPLPRTARRAVTAAMSATMDSMGDRFAANLEREVRR